MQGLDLVGMTARENRKKAKFTVLTRNGAWTSRGISAIAARIFTDVYSHPKHPSVLMLNGEHSEATILSILGPDVCTCKLVIGSDNPELPFPPPSY